MTQIQRAAYRLHIFRHPETSYGRNESMAVLFGALSLDQIHTSYWILASLGAVIVVVGLLQTSGFIDWVLGTVSRMVRGIVRTGFRIWARTLSWTGWLGLIVLCTGLIVGCVECIGTGLPWIAVPVAALLIAAGAVTCLAYMYISVERYEVGRGFKALYNPEKGQQLAVDLIRYGPNLGVLTLASAAAVTVFSFALLNLALYESGGQSWYQFTDPDAHPVYLDFLAYTFVNLLRIVDVFDLAKSYEFLSVSLIRPVGKPASLLMTGFRSFFMLVLLQQIFASVRQGRLLADTVSDFWSPHVPIRERARSVLPQFGHDAVVPVLVALRSTATLTLEQRELLPVVLAGIGPAAIPGLLRHLHDRHETTRIVTAVALGLLKVRDAVPDLARLSDDPSESVRLAVAEALGRIGEAHATQNASSASIQSVRWWKRAARRIRYPLGQRRKPGYGKEVELAVELLRTALRDPSPAVRGRAATATGQIGSMAAEATEELIELLRADTDDVRIEAATALGQIRTSGTVAISALVLALADPTPEVRTAAANSLGEYRATAADAVSGLIGLLQDTNEAVRTAAAEAIARIGVQNEQATQQLLNGLSSEDNVVRAQTAESLGRIGMAAETAAPALAVALTDTNDRVRAKAAEALGRIGASAAPAAVPALMRLLRDEDNWVRALAAEALGEMGEAAENASPALLRSLQHANPHVRANAAESLGKLRSELSRIPLEVACTDPDTNVRAKAVQAVSRLVPLGSTTKNVLMAALTDPAPEVRSLAAEGVAEWAADWPESVGAIVALVADGNSDVAASALEALHKFQSYPDEAVEAVLVRLRDPNDTWIQSVAALTISRMGKIATGAGADLALVASTGDVELRQAAMRAMAILEPEEALGAFLVGLHDAEADVRKVASAGLQKLGRVPESGIDVVIEALRDPDIRVRTTIASVLGRLDPVPSAAIPFLIENTSAASDDGLRLASTIALRAAGSDVPKRVMVSLLKDANLRVRLTAASAVLSGETDHEDAAVVIREALNDKNPRLRELALSLIEPLGSEIPTFLNDLESTRTVETDGGIRERIERLIAAIPVPAKLELLPTATG